MRPNRTPAANAHANTRRGLTLVELLVVLVILSAIAGLVTTLTNTTVKGAGDQDLTPQEIATRATMREVQIALLGSPTQPGYHTHNLKLPPRIAGLIKKPDSLGDYDPITQRGWNGPYIIPTGATYGGTTEPDFPGFPDSAPDNFIAEYGLDDDPAILDAWGSPIVLIEEEVDGVNYTRLVSAGPRDPSLGHAVIDSTPLIGDLDEPDDFVRGDDLVLFLFTADPNPPD